MSKQTKTSDIPSDDGNPGTVPPIVSSEMSAVSLLSSPSIHNNVDSSHDQDDDDPLTSASGAKLEKKLRNKCFTYTTGYWRFCFGIMVTIILLLLFMPFIADKDQKLHKLGGGGFTMALMICLWLTEALPLPVTGLIPVFTGPMFNIVGSDMVVFQYFNDTILLVVGGIALAQCFEFSNLHKRFALKIILLVGTSPKMLLLGIMLTTSILSMFMNNTSVTALMCPIIMALIECIEGGMRCFLAKEFVDYELDAENEGGDQTTSNRKKSSVVDELPTELKPPPAGGRRGTTFDGTQTLPLAANAILSKHAQLIPKNDSFSTIKSEMGSSFSNLPLVDQHKIEQQKSMEAFIKNTKQMLLLANCYTANLAGTALITGSGTNPILIMHAKQAEQHDPTVKAPEFFGWPAFAMVPMILNVVFLYFFLVFYFLHGKKCLSRFIKSKPKNRKHLKEFQVTKDVQVIIKNVLQESYNSLGRITLHEIEVILIFITVVCLWILTDPKISPIVSQLLEPTIPSLAIPAIIGILIMFVTPRKPEFFRLAARCEFGKAKYETVMEWDYLHQNFPWGIVLLLGGGFAMSKVTTDAGLNIILGTYLKGLRNINNNVLLLMVIYLSTFLTEVASNTAIANILLPVLFTLSHDFHMHPMFLTFPATLACSHAFMFPVSTPPNSIAFAAGKMKMLDMLIPGMVLNITTGLVLFLCTITWGKVIYDF